MFANKDAPKYVKNCPKCQINKHKVNHTEPMAIIPTPQSAFDIISTDTIGPFAKASKDNIYAVTIQWGLTI